MDSQAVCARRQTAEGRGRYLSGFAAFILHPSASCLALIQLFRSQSFTLNRAASETIARPAGVGASDTRFARHQHRY
jgi:hypothetical protein